MDNKALANEIIKKVGGKGNIIQGWHCITRLRFNLSDPSKVDIKGLKELDGVLNAQFQDKQFQVVIGNGVAKVYSAMKEEIGELGTAGSTAAPKGKINPVNVVFDTISGIFNPVLPAIIGAGLLKGFLPLFTMLGWLSTDGSEYFILNMISDAAFYFLPFLLAFSSAKKFKTNEYIAVSLAGILMYPAFAALKGKPPLHFLFMNIPADNYSSSVIPIILSVLLLSYVYRLFEKIIPNMLRIIFTPLLSLLVTATVALFLIAPLGNYVGVYLAKFFVFLFSIAGPVAGFLFAGIMPFIVMTGMAYSFFPVVFDSMRKFGYDIMFLPMSLASNLAQCGATLAVAFKTRNKELRSVAFSAALSASFGITEPAMYGVTLKLKKPMYAAMVGASIGGAINGFFAVKCFAFSLPGITSLPSYMKAGNQSNFLFAFIGVLVSFVLSFVLTMLIPLENQQEEMQKQAAVAPRMKGSKISVLAPISGKTIPLSDIEDDVFADEVLGKGVGIIPSGNVVKAPFDGTVSMVTDTRHALGLTSRDGVELLIHIGINTVSLDGKGFHALVEKGQEIKEGQEIMTFDADVIRQNKLSCNSAIIITNTNDFSDISVSTGKTVKAGTDQILTITQ